ncbi:Plant self-incompatibility S1 [Dillenia turbinata]|uniref:Plant self-incompatibility S1 n=1 Tax=Dillenia turbinata TaxID=194707 RepID=A0AAN8Z9G4_9MAGN
MPTRKETKLAKGITTTDSMAPLKACMFIFLLRLSHVRPISKVSNELGSQFTLQCQSQVRQFDIQLLDEGEFYFWEFSLDAEGKFPWSCVVGWEKSSGTFDAFDPSQDPRRCGPALCDWLAKPDGMYLYVEIQQKYVKEYLWPN